jgi:hypothetical protein
MGDDFVIAVMVKLYCKSWTKMLLLIYDPMSALA